MRYCSIDIETTGLEPTKCDILQFAAILDDLDDPKPISKLPTFTAYFTKKEPLVGEPFALSMHPEILRKIADAQRNKIEQNEQGERFMPLDDLPQAFANFLILNNVEPEKNGLIRVNVAGKNVASFDLQFLKTKITKWWPISFCQRTIDPAILYWDAKRDQQLPDMKTCMERARIKGEVAHTALEDALVVVKLLRHKLLRQKTK
jgi:DNA polymerase III epsilon subunit-like protein